MSKLIITGTPVVSFEFIDLPSVNTHYNKHWRARAVDTAEWRYEAKKKARKWMGKQKDLPYFKSRVMVISRVFPPYEEISDIHNVHIKPLLDGFTSAGLWHDDEWAFVPFTGFLWGGITPHEPREKKHRRTVLDIYYLDSILLNGKTQTLPMGRKPTWGKL